MDRLMRRRETNRKSQQRSREAKDALIRNLQEENERLKAQTQLGPSPSTPSTASRRFSLPSPGLSSTFRSSRSSGPQVVTPPSSIGPPGIASVDLEACRQAFLAVLASVCDPHLNTIHAVCAKFSQSRGYTSGAPDLNPPRPVNRPLNTGLPLIAGETPSVSDTSSWAALLGQPLSTVPIPGQGYEGGLDMSALLDFTNLTPARAFIPPHGEVCGPLSVPFLEPPHPIYDLELDANDIWAAVLSLVDMSKTDAEALAERITRKVRCYGYGPVVMRKDIERACEEFPPLLLPDVLEIPS